MKLRNKIIGGLLCVFMISLVIGVYSSISIGRIHSMSNELMHLSELNDTIVGVLDAHQVWRYSLAHAILFNLEFHGQLDPDMCAWGSWLHGSAATMVDDAILNELIDEVHHHHWYMHVLGGEALELRAQGRTAEAMELLSTRVFPYGEQSIINLQALVERYQEMRADYAGEMSGFVSNTVTIIVALIVIGLIAFVLLSFLTTRSILAPIKVLSSLVSDVSVGKLNVNMDSSNIVNDEIGVLTEDMYNLVGTVKGMTDDLVAFSREATTNGDIEYRINSDRYQGAYKELIDGINGFAENFMQDMLLLLGILDSIGNGEFQAKLKQMPGKKIMLNQKVDALMENLNGVNYEIGLMIESSVNGNLSSRINVEKYPGDWQKIMVGLNNIAKAVNAPLKVISVAIEEMKVGNFDLEKIDAKIAKMGINGSPEHYKGEFRAIIAAFDDTIKEIASYITEVSDDLKAISSGNLTTEITREYVGSFSEIKSSLNIISTSLNKTMTEISAASNQVLSGASQISTSAMNLANGASEQASSIEELNASIELINIQTQQNADSTTQANELSNKSAENARTGNNAMKKMLEAMLLIKESSSSISKIINTIQDIAFQTNLLALNAAVEAARAGEHGKGFSVVAEEVRSLAARSQQAAAETTGLIEDSISSVSTGSDIAETTAEALNTIVDNADEVLQIINNIFTSSKEQTEAVGQVSIGLGQISSVVQSNSAVSEETASSAEELNAQAQLLQQLVSYFKLSRV